MGSAADADALDRVLTDHPWLVDVLLGADWWRRDDGTLLFSARFAADEGTPEGVMAFAEALGLRLEEGSPGSAPALDLPDQPPMSFEEVFDARS